MKHFGAILTLTVFAFWATMNTLVVMRQRQLSNLDKYRAGFKQFIGPEMLRERWMSIYRKNRKIGYTGYRYERRFEEQGVEIHSTLETKVQIEVFGTQQWIEIDGSMVSDEEMRPIRLNLSLMLENRPAAVLIGKRRGDHLSLSLRSDEDGDESLPLPPIPLEELHLGDALVPALPVAGFKVGDTFQVSCFDPVKFGRGLATVEVTSRATREIDGLPVDAYCLESTFRGVTSTSWVTEAGELLLQEFGRPLDDVVLRRASGPSEARRVIRR